LLDRHVPVDHIKVLHRDTAAAAAISEVYEVETLLDHRGSAGNYEFLVQWKGDYEPSWEPQKNIMDDQLLRHYWYRVTQHPK
jgi:hypothetical protein